MRDVFSKVKDEENTEWNYLARHVAPLLKQYIIVVNRSCSFDDVSNKDFNASLIRNVLSVTEGTRYDFNTVKSK